VVGVKAGGIGVWRGGQRVRGACVGRFGASIPMDYASARSAKEEGRT
jgi:hypothetical protein